MAGQAIEDGLFLGRLLGHPDVNASNLTVSSVPLDVATRQLTDSLTHLPFVHYTEGNRSSRRHPRPARKQRPRHKSRGRRRLRICWPPR